MIERGRIFVEYSRPPPYLVREQVLVSRAGNPLAVHVLRHLDLSGENYDTLIVARFRKARYKRK
jgi:hypothetical protein